MGRFPPLEINLSNSIGGLTELHDGGYGLVGPPSLFYGGDDVDKGGDGRWMMPWVRFFVSMAGK